jgi:uncharacterized protein YndB with AHSA1/START domain
MTEQSPQLGHKLTIIRDFEAPREQVWKAWTEPNQIKKWWGPKYFRTPVSEMDLRTGGRYFNCMRSPEGRDYCSTGVYREIIPPKRLVMSDSFADEQGRVVSATHYGMSEDFPLELTIRLTLEERDGGTRLTLEHLGFPHDEDCEGARAGWNESFDKLENLLREGSSV